MKRFVNPVPQFFDDDGNILSGGFVNFYENGSTTTRKNTFNANNGSINTNPVKLSAEGRLPPCWGEGLYTVVVTDADGVQVWQRNDVEFGGEEGQFSDYSAVKTYSQNEIVRYTDGNYYISETNNNIGNAPDVSAANWSEIAFLKYWTNAKPGGYSINDVVFDGGFLFRSIVNNNTAITSVTANWDNLTFNNSVIGDLTVSEDIICRSITADTNTLHVDYTNNRVGVGTLTPSKPLDVSGDINSSGVITSSGLTVDTNTLHVDSANNRVGVGTLTPAKTFDVVGSAEISADLTAAGITSTAGVAVTAGNLFIGSTGFILSPEEGFARRNATLSMTTDTILNKDPQLTVSGLMNGFYQVSGIIVFNTNSGGAGNGLKITLDGDANTTLQTVVWQRFSATAAIDALASATPVFESAGGSDNYIVFNGTIRLDSGGQIAVWVSQNVSSATAVEIKSGSSLLARRIGDGI